MNISRRFKAAETNDGLGLKPSDYLPVLTSIDPQKNGLA
jgi:hypothetical protein